MHICLCFLGLNDGDVFSYNTSYLFKRYAHGPVPLQSQHYTTSQDIINSVNYIQHEMVNYKPNLTQVRSYALYFCNFIMYCFNWRVIWKSLSPDLHPHPPRDIMCRIMRAVFKVSHVIVDWANSKYCLFMGTCIM